MKRLLAKIQKKRSAEKTEKSEQHKIYQYKCYQAIHEINPTNHLRLQDQMHNNHNYYYNNFLDLFPYD